MTSLHLESVQSQPNPLDTAEDVLNQKGWHYERISREDLAIELGGTWSDIRMWMAWKAEIGSLVLTCSFDNRIPDKMRETIYNLMGLVNERLWLGHFEMSSEDLSVNFRYTLILGEKNVVNPDQLDQIITQAYHECERFYPALQSVLWGGQAPGTALEAAIFETVGEA